MDTVTVSITGPDADWLAEHARSLINDRLASSGNLIPAIRSIYRWQGDVYEGAEAYLLLQTQRHHVAEIVRRTNDAHPYVTPHVLAFAHTEASPDYQKWIIDSTTSES